MMADEERYGVPDSLTFFPSANPPLTLHCGSTIRLRGDSMIRRISLVMFACAMFVPLAAACGGGSTPKTITNAQGTVLPANDAKTSPTVAMPVSRFAVSLDDLDTSVYRTDVAGTFTMDAAYYGGTQTFDSAAQGKTMLEGWGYEGGYETGYLPISAPQSVLNGAYYSNVEIHLFKDTDGAKKAYAYFQQRLGKSAAKQADTPQLGNESVGYSAANGLILGTEVGAEYEQFMFRRGNVVGVVLTYGAAGFMNINTARSLAVIEDNKILGKTKAVEPTPISNFTPNEGTGQGIKGTATPAATSSAAAQ